MVDISTSGNMTERIIHDEIGSPQCKCIYYKIPTVVNTINSSVADTSKWTHYEVQ